MNHPRIGQERPIAKLGDMKMLSIHARKLFITPKLTENTMEPHDIDDINLTDTHKVTLISAKVPTGFETSSKNVVSRFSKRRENENAIKDFGLLCSHGGHS
jgi:hypothetical protein